MDSRSSGSSNIPPKKKRRVKECGSDNAAAPLMRDTLELLALNVKEKSFQLVPASPSLCELNEGFSDSFHSPAEKQQEKTLSTPPTLTSLTSFTPSTIEKNVTPPTFSTPPTLKPLLKFQAMPKAVGASSLPPPRRLKSSTVKRSLDFGNTDRKLNEEWLARIMKSRCDQQDMNCPTYKQPSLTLASMLGSNTVMLPYHPNDTVSSERQPRAQYLSILRYIPREQ